MRILLNLLLLCGLCCGQALATEAKQDGRAAYDFTDYILDDELKYPDWFKTSFGDFREDLKNATRAGKEGIMLYFGQKRCSYCERFLQVNLGAPDIQKYFRKHFDAIPIDIWGINDIITLDGKETSEEELAIKEQTNFTPSLIFYDAEGKEALRLRGYYPPYKFRAALQYIVEGFYKTENLRDYMARADPTMIFDPEGLNEQEFFAKPPFNLDRSRFKGEKPLLVFFEQGKCHACDVLHTGPLTNPELRRQIHQMEVVQLDMWSDVPVVTPNGKRTTAKQWANELGLFFAPAMIFFDESGRELMRVDAVTQFYRLLGVFNYMNSRAYQQFPNFQKWRIMQRGVAR